MKRPLLTRSFLLGVVFSLFQKTDAGQTARPGAVEAPAKKRGGRIRCPECDWRPRASSRWFCAACPAPEGFFGVCDTEWNTFDTHGVCPGCGHAWRWTVCLHCSKWSLHEDWYVREDDDTGS
ncbi:MAG TPA: hypothetical protein PKI11_20270 [Candidatus Hydrogenedentes bacterium]|nr:hypothetical protein [Candidatus Hydrogenedentota bacterium]HNT88470.1 hypothetical protein [Candidatus Hydrogenedentota bacterium]